MLPKKKSKNRIVLNLVICFILLALSALVILFRQRIIDQISVLQFEPTSEILSLTNRLGLSSEGKFYFYASHPELESAADFNQSCNQTNKIENTTSVLGCFTSSRIYIYNVTDEKLNGIREVTAAHEMLHAVYQRLDDSEKNKLTNLLEAEYKKLSSDANFADLMAFYDKTEPGEKYNELFSVIGTTVADIDPLLESYYDKYFSDRQAIVNYNKAYNGVFKDLSDQATALSSQLDVLSKNIPTETAQYNADVNTLNADIDLFNARAAAGDFGSLNQFYLERANLESRVSAINDTRASVNADIDKYNSLLDKYNSIALESQQLYNSIDSKLAEAESVE